MYEVNWLVLLEYVKVALSWPPLVFIGVMVCLWRFQAEIARVIARLEKFKAGSVEAVIGAAQQAQAAKVETTFPLPGEGPGESLAPPVPAAVHQAPQEQPGQLMPQGDAQEPAFDWTIAEEAISLAPAGVDLNAVAHWVHRNPGPTVRDFVMTNSSLKAERCFNLIFGTQVDLLEYLRLSPGSHPLGDLMPFHEKHVALVAAPQPVAIHAYLAFLLNQGLMENVGPPEGPLYRLTRGGDWVLGYIKQFYPLVWNKRAL